MQGQIRGPVWHRNDMMELQVHKGVGSVCGIVKAARKELIVENIKIIIQTAWSKMELNYISYKVGVWQQHNDMVESQLHKHTGNSSKGGSQAVGRRTTCVVISKVYLPCPCRYRRADSRAEELKSGAKAGNVQKLTQWVSGEVILAFNELNIIKIEGPLSFLWQQQRI